MSILIVIVAVVAGLGAGGALAAHLLRQQRATSGELLQRLVTTNQAVFGAERDRTAAEVDGKKSLIDQQLAAMAGRLDEVSDLVRVFEADRDRKFGQLSQQLSQQSEGLTDLLHTTQSLREVLASPKTRGRWGERMAEDVLRLADFIENVNYRKQRAAVGGHGIPDFTFFLPNDLVVHMDVKFPLDNYVRYVESESDLDRKRYRDDFLRDVRGRVKELSTREYVDPAGGTVDFVLLFIPNEQLYTFIHETDETIVQDASRRRVVLCSPLTLLAVLALIRQTCENFQLARRSDEILGLLGHFFEQWEKFVGQMDTLGKRIDSTSREYEALVGTRKRMLEKRIGEINALRNDSRSLTSVDEDDEADEDDDGLGGALALEA
jgi:DNA recombination protein RmuC